MEWIVRVDWRPDADVDLERVVNKMARMGPVLDVSRTGTWSVTITIDAPTLRLAVADSLHHVEAATGERATAIDARPAEELVWTGG